MLSSFKFVKSLSIITSLKLNTHQNSCSILKMAARLDIILFGASGFTGKHTIPQLFKFTKTDGRSLTWGVAGRSEQKLKDALIEYEAILGENLSDIPIIIADVKDEESLKRMTARAKIIINCCGPFRFFGEPVIKACIETGTHHVDVSGEPQYMEKMQLEYNKAAQEKGVYIISACGLDSVPVDLGIVFLQDKFEGTLNSVETFISTSTDGSTSGSHLNYGTWESAVHSLAHENELRPLRSKLFPKRLPKLTPPLKSRFPISKSDIIDGWILPFPGSDRSVAIRSQYHFFEKEKKRPLKINSYVAFDSFLSVLLIMWFGAIFVVMSKFEFGRKLLLRHPKFFSGGMFSHEGPSEEAQKKLKFSLMLYGEGWKEKKEDPLDEFTEPINKVIVGRVSGYNPGYGATCIMLTWCAITVLSEKDKLPDKGGVMPPGAAFAKTSLIDNLNKNDVTFEVVKIKEL